MNPTHRESRAIPLRAALVASGLVTAGLTGAVWYCAGRRARSRSGPRRVVVEGRSMLPDLQPGDRLLVRRGSWPRSRRLREGDIVAFHDPRTDEGRILVKRVRAVTAAGLDVRGDNPGSSTDSRAFGPVGPRAVIGRVTYRYAPPGRVGRLGPRDRAGAPASGRSI